MNYYLKCFQNYANFSGRARRMEYWMFWLFTMLLGYGLIILGLLSQILIFNTIGVIVLLGSLLPLLAVGVRRMHDTGNSGWYLLIPIYSLILLFTDSEPGSNNWGPNPKTHDDDTTFDFEKVDNGNAQ